MTEAFAVKREGVVASKRSAPTMTASALLLLIAGGTSFAAFEETGAGARAPGMANVFTAVADDVYAIHYNAAGLGTVERSQVGMHYSRLHMGLSDGSNLSRSQIVTAMPLNRGRWGTLGLNWSHLALSGLYTERTLGVGYGLLALSGPRLGSLYVGAQAKQLHRGLGSSPEMSNALTHGAATGRADPVLSGKGRSAIGADLGLLWRPRGRLAVGAAVKNLNQPDLGFGEGDKLPLSARLGLSYKSLWMTLAAELRSERAPTGKQDRIFALAGERIFPSLDRGEIGLRAGFGLGTRDIRQVTVGASYRLNKIGLDYAFAMPLGTIAGGAGTHQLGMTLRFGAPSPDEELSMELASQMQRLRQRQAQEAGYEPRDVAQAADLDRPDLAEVRARVLAGEYLLAHQRTVRLFGENPADSSLLHLARRLDMVSAFFPELPKPREAWELALSSGILAYLKGREAEALLFLSYGASLNRQLLAAEKLLARVESATGLKGIRPAEGLSVLDYFQQQAASAFRQRDYQRSLDRAQDALLLKPDDLGALKRVGSNLYMLGFHPEAAATWERALALETNPSERAAIKNYLARVRAGRPPSPAAPAPASALPAPEALPEPPEPAQPPE
ncbi:MAG: hypothetical protein HY554_05185, partial [Elusimicrobia bacterium]|nr:hypothetical protein [Elusimicrobiota bacterium]